MSRLPPRTPRRSTRDLPPAVDGGSSQTPVENYGIWYRSDRPRIVGMIGWFCAGIGYLTFVFKGAQLPSYFMDMSWLRRDWTPMPLSREQFTVNVLLLIANMLLGLLAIAAGLGSLKMREWGRRCAIYYGIAAILLGVITTAWQYHNFDFMMKYQLAQATQPVNAQQAENAQFFYFVTARMMLLVWPLIIITMMTRRYVKAAFDKANGIVGEWQSS